MLKKFEVKGFKNFENKITLNFSDIRDYQFNSSCVHDDLLSKIIIYGKNSTGKTNFGLALFDIVSHMTTNHIGPGLYDYYLNANNEEGRAWFHYVFSFAENEVDYSYEKNDAQTLLSEKVLINSRLLFSYDYQTKKGDLSGLKEMNNSLNLSFLGNDSILRYAITNSALPNEHPLYKMQRFVSRMLWFRSLDENRYLGYKSSSSDYYSFIFKDNRVAEFEKFLHQTGLKEDLMVLTDPDGEKRLYLKANNPLPFFKTASSGTKALYTFFYWYKTAEDVSLLFIDEFDAFYHYELAETIVRILEKIPWAQVLLTSHNTNLLSNRIMRPDCYFILSENRLTSFANATKRELREGHNLEKLYISGEFND